MSQPIGFNDLFNKKDFNDGVASLVTIIGQISTALEGAKVSATGLAGILGKSLKDDIKALSTQSATLARDIQDINTKMNQFKQTTAQTDDVIKAYEKETARLKAELDKLKVAQDQVNGSMGNAGKATKTAGLNFSELSQSLLGVSAGAALVHRGIQMVKDQLIIAVKSTIAFEKTMKEVQAVSNATSNELKLLADNANKLGSSTEKTAQQVAEAQKELAKLGFTTPEILLATAAIVDLSTATGEDLVKTAEVAASTIRGFGLEVSDLRMVTDVMTKSFIISALDLEKFRESMKLVAPIAAATGIGIEAVTASLAKLSDTGISGSLAGTAMRNLISSMADPTEDLVKFIGQYDETLKDGVKSSEDFTRALQVLRGANIDLETAVGMVDVRARTAFFTLVNYADDVEYLALQLKYLDGETKQVADDIRDSLANDILIASSAFDSMSRNIVEDYIPAMRDATQATTTIIEAIRLMNDGVIFQNSVIADVIKGYLKWMIAINPLVLNFRGLKWIAEQFGYTWQDMEEAVAEGNAIQTFESVAMNLDAMVDSFSGATEEIIGFDKAVVGYTESNKLIEEGTKASEDSITALKILFPKLSNVVEDNADFLKLLRGETKGVIDTTRGYITALLSEEQRLKDLITVTKEAIKTNGVSEETTKTLTDANTLFIITQNLRFEIEEKLNNSGVKANLTAAEATELLKQQADQISKVIKLKAQLLNLQNKTKEDQAKINLEDEKDLEKKLPLLEKLKVVKIKTAKDALSGELAEIDKSDTSKEEKEIERAIAYASHKKELLAIDEDYYKQADSIMAQMLAKEQLLLKAQREEYSKTAKDVGKTKFTDVENDIAKSMEAYEKELLAKDNLKAEFETDQLKKQNKADEEGRDKRIAIAEQVAQGLSDITTRMFDNQAIKRENEMRAIDAWEQERLSMAGDNEEAKALIEKEAEERRKKVRIEQAKADKKEALFQIAIATAVNVVKLIGTAQPWLVAAAIAAGLLQAAIVASKPLPQFAKGTNYSPEGHAVVGERGRELIVDGKTGKTRLSSDSASITHLSRGSKVIPHHLTEKLLSDPNFDHNGVAEKYLNKASNIKVEKPAIDYDMIGRQFKDAVTQIPLNKTVFDENGVTNYVIKRTSTIRRINKRY